MQHIDLTKKQFNGLKSLPIDGPFQMLNLLKFKKVVEGTEMTGEEAYTHYIHEAYPFFKKSKAKVLYDGKLNFTVIGPSDEKEWDKILIVEYADKESFLSMITSEDYPAALRSRALEDSRLILCINN